MQPVSAANLWTAVGLALLLLGCIVGVFPLLPLTPAGGATMINVPHTPFAATVLVLAGVGLLLWRRSRPTAPPH